MSQPRAFTETNLRKVLSEVGSKMKRRISAYLIGGCAMAFMGRKAATKDVDIVFVSDRDAESFASAMELTGFVYVQKPTSEYNNLGAFAIMEDSGGIRFDIFHSQVCRKLELSESMKSRARHYGSFGNIDVYLMSPEDIFLFKGITERATDLDDMRILVESRLDWQIIEKECLSQNQSGRWAYSLGEKLLKLRAKFGINSPIIKALMDHADLELLRYVFEAIITEGKDTFKEISKAIRDKYQYSDSWTRKQLGILTRKGIIGVKAEGRRHIYCVKSRRTG